MSELIDKAARELFVTVRDRNISVIAPAGVGKTTSIVQRIVSLAENPGAEEILPKLIVVTYSVRAAQEMQQRTRIAIRDAKVSPKVQRAFQQTFFGTIHSYCVRLLDRFGHYLGLPTSMALLEADDELWNRFLVRGMGTLMPSGRHLEDLFHFYPVEKLYALGRDISPGPEMKIGPAPELNWKKLLDFRDDTLSGPTKKSIAKAQTAAQEWGEAWRRGDRFRPLPKCPTSELAASFAVTWNETFAPLDDWLRQGALAFGRNVANAYAKFRESEAVMTYDDQIRLALEALKLSEVQKELAEEKLSVLLDEAQDTDPRQFEVLQRVAGLGKGTSQADGQTFSVVGDFQQAIYAPRSDLSVYQKVHDLISTGERGTSSELKVTFRCDKAIIDWVNLIFPTVLNQTGGQAKFVKLEPRHGAGQGQVARWPCPDEPDQAGGEKINAAKRAQHEARWLAERIRDLGPSGLGAESWSQVALLCPRKDWLLDLERELVELKLPVQLHSSNEEQRERTPIAWLTALLWIAAHPEDSFEIAGVLRDILGVPDDDMALFTGKDGDRLRLDRPASEGEGTVEKGLEILREALAGAERLPLHRVIQQVMEKTHLRARLNSIPEMALENAERVLDDFLAGLMVRCTEGVTLAELAEEARRGLTQTRPAEEEIRDAIQLLTSYKSKGLEWQAVIVPYMFRRIETKHPSYPRLVLKEGGNEIVCRDKTDFTAQAHSYVTERNRQQYQRLLYVTCTRAKRTLVFIDDEILYAPQIRRPGWSSGELLGLANGTNAAAWRELPETLLASDALEPVESLQESMEYAAPDLTQDNLQKALERAGTFPRRVTPHALANHTSNEAEPERAMEAEEEQAVVVHSSPGILYGTWWHEFMETIPWQKPVEAWQRKFDEALVHSPDRERSIREWDLFCRSDLAKWLAEPGRLVQVEIPFLWRETDQECLEGVMDLAVFAENESGWRVIDWKTNRIGAEGSAGLNEIYRGQIQAYVRALRGIVQAEVRGSLYLTQSGEWVEV